MFIMYLHAAVMHLQAAFCSIKTLNQELQCANIFRKPFVTGPFCQIFPCTVHRHPERGGH
jgi:hypothetical protein